MYQSGDYIAGLILGSKGDSLSNQSGLDVNENDKLQCITKGVMALSIA